MTSLRYSLHINKNSIKDNLENITYSIGDILIDKRYNIKYKIFSINNTAQDPIITLQINNRRDLPEDRESVFYTAHIRNINYNFKKYL